MEKDKNFLVKVYATQRRAKLKIKKGEYWRCRYCGKWKRYLTDFSKPTRDHVIPLSRGGQDRLENIVPACWKCNHKKGNELVPLPPVNPLYKQ